MIDRVDIRVECEAIIEKEKFGGRIVIEAVEGQSCQNAVPSAARAGVLGRDGDDARDACRIHGNAGVGALLQEELRARGRIRGLETSEANTGIPLQQDEGLKGAHILTRRDALDY